MNLPIQVAIERSIHDIAKDFASQQTSTAKGKQVYLNTLAVLSVKTYLGWIGIESSLDESDSWQPGIRALMDVADLSLPRFGKLECRPVLPEDKALMVPEVIRLDDRIGYIAVKLEQDLKQAKLLGFIAFKESIEVPDEIPLSKLQPVENLIDYLESIEIEVLRLWLIGQFQKEDWKEPMTLIPSVRSIPLTRTTKAKCREKELADLLNAQALGVQLQITGAENNEFIIQVRLAPSNHSLIPFLSEGTQFNILDQDGKVVMPGTVKQDDAWIEHIFSGKQNEKFSIEIIVAEEKYIESFLI